MRVGTSSRLIFGEVEEKDHPHACGDKRKTYRLTLITSGSSPCVWGQVKHFDTVADLKRIIPMRVGTRQQRTGHGKISADHPHACGDKSTFYPSSNYSIGSSPCVWGQVIIVRCIVKPSGIIPMRVGTSTTNYDNIVADLDHPHACGDKKFVAQALLSVTGSSPCVWGQENINLDMDDVQRIIPMRVGTSGDILSPAEYG